MLSPVSSLLVQAFVFVDTFDLVVKVHSDVRIEWAARCSCTVPFFQFSEQFVFSSRRVRYSPVVQYLPVLRRCFRPHP